MSYRRRIIKRKDRGDGLMVNLTFLYRVKRMLIIITSRVEELIKAQDKLLWYIEIGGRR